MMNTKIYMLFHFCIIIDVIHLR